MVCFYNKIVDIKFENSELHIFHQCLDDKSFLSKGTVSCRYFNDLPDWLEKEKSL